MCLSSWYIFDTLCWTKICTTIRYQSRVHFKVEVLFLKISVLRNPFNIFSVLFSQENEKVNTKKLIGFTETLLQNKIIKTPWNSKFFEFSGTISVSLGGLVVVFAVNGNQRRQVIVVDLDVVADARLSIQVSCSVKHYHKFPILRGTTWVVLWSFGSLI